MPKLEEIHIRQAPSPLPAPPEKDALSAEQWGILTAIADTVVPAFTQLEGNRLLQHPLRREVYEASCKRLEQGTGLDGSHDVANYLAESATSQPDFKNGVSRLVNVYMHEEARKQFLFVLDTLNSRAGAFLLTGYSTPLDCLPIQTREQIILGWANARLPLLRQLHKGLTSLVKLIWIRTSPTLGRVLSYPRTPVHENPPGSFYPFKFLQIPPSDAGEAETIETDVVIVGSGCGGAVAAKVLAEAGLKVIVVDKAYYWPPEHLPMSEYEAAGHLFANSGFLQTDDQCMPLVAGSAWGGGGTINWSASLQTQGYVRREWAQKFGLKHFASAAFQSDLDAICDRMGVGTAAVEHNKTNQVLLEGARKLGWSAKTVPQNTGGEAHNCGYCTLGCGSCGKKGPTETFLPDAANAGATFIEGFEVNEVLFGSDGTTENVVSGVKGWWTSRDGNGGVAGTDRTRRQVFIKASKVVVASGSIYSPLLLRRSGLANPHIGRHLHLHPACHVGAVWDEDVRPWEGPILTAVVNEFENLDGEGYGAKLEANTMIPGMFLPLLPWRGGLEWKECAAKMRRMTGYISLARDRYGGKVYPDPINNKHPRVQYHPSKYDKSHILEGLVHLAELLYVAGAREIFTTIPEMDSFVRPTSDDNANVQVTGIEAPSLNDSGFQVWLGKLRKLGLPASSTPFASAHQMGSCRMGVSPDNSVVDPKGRVWGTKGLYVADASVFPSASGVNPMITTMGISRGIARGIVDEAGLPRRASMAIAKL